MNDALASWLGQLGQLAAEPPTVEGNTVRVTLDASKARSGESLNTGQAPEDFSLVLDGVLRPQEELAFQEELPREVAVRVPNDVRNLVFTIPEGHAIPSIQLDIDAREKAVAVSGTSTMVLVVKGGQFSIRGAAWPDHLVVEDTTADIDQGLRTLTLSGAVNANGTMQAIKAFVRGEVTIGGGDWRLGELLSLNLEPPRLRVASGTTVLRWVAEGAELTCDGGSLELGREGERRPMRSLVLSGQGRIHAVGLLEEPRFVAREQPVELSVLGRVLDAEGEVALTAHSRAVVSGGPSGALALRAVRDVTGAEVDNVDIYGLTIGDLAPLRQAERFYPWLPRPRKCREREDAMFAEEEKGLARRRRMHFWSGMTAIVKDTHAPGRVQSEVRYAAQHARQRALPWRKERLLLYAYWLLGYGERILRPLVWYAVLSLALAAWFAGPFERTALTWNAVLETWNTVAPMWWKVAQAPLSFFRLTTGPFLDSTAQQAALLSFRVIGLLLLVLSLLAVRRLVRLE